MKIIKYIAVIAALVFILIVTSILARTLIAYWLEKLLHDLYVLLILICIVAVIWLVLKLRRKATR